MCATWNIKKVTVVLPGPQEPYLGFQEGEMVLAQKDTELNCSLINF